MNGRWVVTVISFTLLALFFVSTSFAAEPLPYGIRVAMQDRPRLLRMIDIESAAFDGITATPDSEKLYVTARIDDPLRFVVLVIDTASDQVIRQIELGEEGAPDSSARQILISPDGERVYAMTPLNNVFAIDVATDTILDSVNFGQREPMFSSRDIEISRDGSKIYIANFDDEELTVIDTVSMRVSRRVPIASYVNKLSQSPSGDHLYVLSSNRGDSGDPEPILVSVVDTRSLSVLEVIPVGRGFWANGGVGGRISADQQTLYVQAASSEVVSVVDLIEHQEVDRVEVGLYGEQIDLSRDDAFVWFFRNGFVTDGSIDVIDTESLQVVDNIPQGGMENGQLGRFMRKYTVFTPDGRYAIVPQYFAGSIWVVDVDAGEVTDRFETGGNPTCLYYLPNGEKAYATVRDGRGYGIADGKLAVISLTGEGACVRDPEWICDGDVDGDGQVNPVDSGLVQAAFGSADESDLCNYDVDCDGQINPVDSGIVQSLFGTCEEPREVCP